MTTQPTIIKPTIGRKVWLQPQGASVVVNGTLFSPLQLDCQPLDATVIYVWGDRMVNLDVTDHAGNRFVATSVTLVQPGEIAPSAGFYCEWMPYQVSQAPASTAMAKLPVADQLDDVKSKLYLGIEEAIQLLAKVPAGDSEFVDRAFNKLREIQWIEVPAPARILDEVRQTSESAG